jgi:hypothetical protein
MRRDGERFIRCHPRLGDNEPRMAPSVRGRRDSFQLLKCKDIFESRLRPIQRDLRIATLHTGPMVYDCE